MTFKYIYIHLVVLLIFCTSSYGQVAHQTTIGSLKKGDTIDYKFNEIDISRIINSLDDFKKGIHIKNAMIVGTVNLHNKQIDVPLYFSNCIFYNKFNVDYTHVNNLLTIDQCVFTDTFNGQNFYLQSVNISHSRFQRPVTLSNGVVSKYAYFEKDTFQGYADFSGTVFESSISYLGSRFEDSSEYINVNCDGQINFDSCTFKKYTSFDQLKASGFVHFFDAYFNDVTFVGSVFKYSFFIENTTFRNADFNSIVVNGNLSLENSIFNGYVRMSSAQVMNNFYFSNVSVDSAAGFYNMHVNSTANFNNTTFKSRADFSGASFKQISFKKTTFDSYYSFSGLTYSSIKSENNNDSLTLALVENADYNYKNYKTLENYYRDQGDDVFANQVFYKAQKEEAERDGIFHVVLNWLSYVIIRNGKKPAGALILAIGIILTGAIVFRKKGWMEIQDDKDQNQPYIPLLYSFDLFIPFIDLYYKGIWRPTPENMWRYYYMRVHTFLGWIIVPWLLAYWTGLVK